MGLILESKYMYNCNQNIYLILKRQKIIEVLSDDAFQGSYILIIYIYCFCDTVNKKVTTI